MARPLRLEFAGALYHVTTRGNNKARIFLDRDDHERFLAILGRVVPRYEWICHAYCLMGNHYHVLVETPRPSLCDGMRQLNGLYAQGFNQGHGRVGHLYQGRYKAVLVEKEAHLLALASYIVCNPIRARLCTRPEDWLYSSYRATAGFDPVPAFLTVDWLLSQFADGRRLAQARYRAYVTENAYRPWEQLRGQIYLGSDEFIDAIVDSDEPLDEIPRPQWQPLPPALTDLFRTYGDAALPLAHSRYGYRLREIADHLGVHYSTVGRRLDAWEEGQAPKSQTPDAGSQDLTPDAPR
jgi:REP-associated tyrosine transposase